MISYCADDLRRMNRTARQRGAVGHNAVTPRAVAKVADKGDLVLDYGCGKSEAHGNRLCRDTGAEVHFYDIGANGSVGRSAQFEAHRGLYDIAYASNVLNVQANAEQIIGVFRELAGAVHHAGLVVFNYPSTPRHAALSTDALLKLATLVFGMRPQPVAGFGGVYQVMKV